MIGCSYGNSAFPFSSSVGFLVSSSCFSVAGFSPNDFRLR